jgi:hypothetical protein
MGAVDGALLDIPLDEDPTPTRIRHTPSRTSGTSSVLEDPSPSPECGIRNRGLKYGCIVFDDIESRRTGWYAVDETEEGDAMHLDDRGASAVPSDTVMLTNIDYEHAIPLGYMGNYRFLHSGYLREDLNRLGLRLGLIGREAIRYPRKLVTFGATLLNRTMNVCTKLLDIGPEEDFLPYPSLNKGMRELLGPEKDHLVDEEVGRIAEDAVVYNINCERPVYIPLKEDVIEYLHVPAYRHCKHILETPLPDGEAEEMRWGAIPPSDASRDTVMDFMIDGPGNAPGFFMITCEGFDYLPGRIINFGFGRTCGVLREGQARKGARRGLGARRWVTNPELCFLLRYGDVHIHDAVVFPNSVILADRIPRVDDSVAKDLDASLSMSVFYENLWTGMCCKRGRSRSAKGKMRTNLFTPFLRAVDRVILAEKAIAFAERGFDVAGYATGALRISMLGVEPMRLYTACKETGMLPPFLSIPLENLKHDKDHQSALSQIQLLYAANLFDAIGKLDKAIVDKVLAQA